MMDDADHSPDPVRSLTRRSPIRSRRRSPASEQTIRTGASTSHRPPHRRSMAGFSKPALLMLLDDDKAALRAYLAGDRTSERVANISYALASPEAHKNSKISKPTMLVWRVGIGALRFRSWKST